MDDPDYHKRGYFDAPFSFKTYRNLLFAYFQFVFSLISFILTIILLVVGIPLILIWVGVPIINLTFYITGQMASFQRFLYLKMYKKNIPSIEVSLPNQNTQLKVFYSYTKNGRSWRYIIFNLVDFFMNIAGVLISSLLLFESYLLIHTPFRAMFGHIEFLGYQTDFFIEAIIFFFVGLIIWFGIMNLINIWANFHIRVIRYFLSR